MKLKIYGSRGSMALFDRKNIKYGGNSACFVLDIDGYMVVLDCGSGLVKFYEDAKDRFNSGFKCDILLSHLHIDHIIGFSAFPPLYAADSQIRVFTRSRSEQPLISQILGIYKPPYWPVDISQITKMEAIEISSEEPFALSENISVTPLFVKRHNQTAVYRIDADKSVVYLLDYEIQKNMDRHQQLVDFCKNVDLIIFDFKGRLSAKIRLGPFHI
jgi:phosphoribosyl 1,2-cyclic phosphodiesterase